MMEFWPNLITGMQFALTFLRLVFVVYILLDKIYIRLKIHAFTMLSLHRNACLC